MCGQARSAQALRATRSRDLDEASERLTHPRPESRPIRTVIELMIELASSDFSASKKRSGTMVRTRRWSVNRGRVYVNRRSKHGGLSPDQLIDRTSVGDRRLAHSQVGRAVASDYSVQQLQFAIRDLEGDMWIVPRRSGHPPSSSCVSINLPALGRYWTNLVGSRSPWCCRSVHWA